MSSFFEKLAAASARNRSLLCVGLDPTPAQVPARYQTGAATITAAILAWNRAIIEQTSDLVCCYKPNIAFYEALGAAGMELLRQTLELIPDEIPVVLDAKRGDIGTTAEAYAVAAFDDLRVDAITLSPYLGKDSVAPFLHHAGKGVFVLCHTSNPSAGDFQHLEVSDWRTLDREPNQPLYLHVARTATQWGEQVGLVVGATYPAAVAAVRSAAPNAWFLVPGIGAQGGNVEATLAAGLRDDGSGLIINASRAVMLADDPRAAAEQLRSEIEEARAQVQATRQSSALAVQPSTAGPEREVLITALHALGAVKFGDFTLASGIKSPIYVDLRLLVSDPAVLGKAGDAYAQLLAQLPCDRIAGVPYAALPIATAVALATGKPMIYQRKEAKSYGLGKLIEGAFQPGERVVIIEDLITSGGSTLKTAEQLREAGLVVEHVLVLIDRQQGGVAALAEGGIAAHAVFTLTEIVDSLAERGLLAEEKRAEVRAVLGNMAANG